MADCPAGLQDVRVTTNGTGARVCGPRYQVEFGQGGAHFPYQLIVDGMHLVADGVECNDERGIGLALHPSLRINGEDAPQVTSTLAVELGSTTDAIVKIALTWNAAYACGGGAAVGELGRRSTFTFLPDGQIHRFDRIEHPATVTSGNCSSCRPASQGSPFYLTSYTTLAVDMGGYQILGATGGNQNALTTYGQSINAGEDVCITTRGRHVGFGWYGDNTQLANPSRVRVVRTPMAGQAGAIAFIFDQLNNATQITPTNAATLLETTMIVGSSDTNCAAVLSRVATHRENRLLHVVRGTDQFDIAPNLDGIYGGERPDGTVSYDIPGVPDSPFTMSIPAGGQPIVGGFAVWFDFASFYPNITAVRTPASANPNWIRFQHAPPPNQSQVVFWFPDGLGVGQTITIDPSP
ncbi:MAG: hypothetical protein M3619_20290 [Myxococcota bacterium]|nr:hypothetical protein [Myxococcota bacterium]